MKHVFLISPYWKEKHRWMVSSVKLAELWQRIGYRVTVVCMGPETKVETVSDTLTIHYRKDVFLPDPWNYGIAPGFAGYVRRLIAREKPDVIAANKILFWSSLSVIALCLTGRRVILLTDALVGMTWWPRSLFPKICAAVLAELPLHNRRQPQVNFHGYLPRKSHIAVSHLAIRFSHIKKPLDTLTGNPALLLRPHLPRIHNTE